MPYIHEEARERIHDTVKWKEQPACKVKALYTEGLNTPGELNYAITILLLTFMKEHGKSYTTMNNIVGAVECAKQEFIRRHLNPYEDEKIQINGDVTV